MKILVTGSNGQLGNEIRELSSDFPNLNFLYTDIEELDITSEIEVNKFFEVNKPDAIINCAAYTAVDKAESDEKLAFLINDTAVGILARVTSDINALFIHISTDYVFDGTAHLPYQESDKRNPVSAYASTKYAGELAVEKYATKAIILRTSWLYSAFGGNFVKTILKYGKERGVLNVVSDQIGTPTYARDLARTILTIIPKAEKIKGVEIYHYSNEGVASWYDFAKAIVEISGINCIINPIGTKDYPLPAKRPFYSVLDKSKIKVKFKTEIPYWRDSLKHCLQRIENLL
jgi:dTDP-4-dehydrorhamnose reductase